MKEYKPNAVYPVRTNRLNDLAFEIHEIAKEKGWWDKDKIQSPLETHMLIVSEIAEATECVRNNQSHIYVNPITKDISLLPNHGYKPEGEAVELVDAMIRILDYFEHKGWDVEKVLGAKMDYNKTRSYRHGGKEK